MGLAKFRGQKDDKGNPVSWDRADIDGVPFRGRMPLMSPEEFDQKVEREVDGHVQAFRLWLPEEKEACESVLDRIANRWYVLIDRDRQYVPEFNNWVVLLIWTVPYNTIRSKPGDLPALGR